MSVEQCRELFTSFYGCDGGDIGNGYKPSIWLCGIEWGGKSEDLKWFEKDISEVSKYKEPQSYTEYDAKEGQRKVMFNRYTLGLLGAITEGREINWINIKEFAETNRPFYKDSGYFKLNLYPLSFQTVDHSHWNKFKDELKRLTGFDTKDEYQEWIRQNRFPIMRKWARAHKPKLIICVGIGNAGDFEKAFGDENSKFKWEMIQDRQVQKYFGSFKNKDGTLVVNIPFFYGSSTGSIKSYRCLKDYANKIKTLLEA